jgi:hypothetical protein
MYWNEVLSETPVMLRKGNSIQFPERKKLTVLMQLEECPPLEIWKEQLSAAILPLLELFKDSLTILHHLY